jgi:hypothetical protein
VLEPQEYSLGPRATQDVWQEQRDGHAQVMDEVVVSLEERLVEYEVRIQDIYRKVFPSHHGVVQAEKSIR